MTRKVGLKKIRGKIEIGRFSVGESGGFRRPDWLPPNSTRIKNRKYKISSNRNQIGKLGIISIFQVNCKNKNIFLPF